MTTVEERCCCFCLVTRRMDASLSYVLPDLKDISSIIRVCVYDSETASPNPSNKHGRLSPLPTECAEMADRGSGTAERGRRAGGGAAKPVLADILTGIIHRERETRQEGKGKKSEARARRKMVQKAGREEAGVAFYRWCTAKLGIPPDQPARNNMQI